MANRIVVNGTEIDGSRILAGKIESSHAMVGETLSADQFSFEISTHDEPFIPADQDHALITADNKLYFARCPIDVSTFKSGDEVLCYSGNSLLGKYFFEETSKLGSNRYKITALSIIGRLLNSKHYGGIYSQTPASQVFSSILDGIPYSIDPGVAAATVTGYLPIALRRDNLQQLLAATGSTVKVIQTGAVIIEPMSSVSTGVFDASRCYDSGSITTAKPVSGIKLTEHNYIPSGNTVTLFNDGVDGTELIEFSEPYHDLSITGGTILESGANYAKISAKGTVTLTGHPYTHVTRIVTAGSAGGVSSETVKSITNFYLASPQVAQALAERFLSYYRCNLTIRQDVVASAERAGDVVSVLNPDTGALCSATIKKYTIDLSTVNKASAEFLVGFEPQGTISGFKNYVLLTGSGSWIVPAGVVKIRLIIVGAGGGGSGGKRGTAGTDSKEGTPGQGGAGGAGGTPGTGGKVFEISIDVTPGQVLPFACGVHGVGGTGETDTQAQSDGTAGTPTTIGAYSSDNGRAYPYGYLEAKTGLTLATNGAAGYAGGRGGDGSKNLNAYANPMKYGMDGEAVQGYAGGRGAPATVNEISERHEKQYAGGGGGGAAYGKAGGDGRGWSRKSATGGEGATGYIGSNGTAYGQGGGAGNGGGGGGGGGIAYDWDALFTSSWMVGSGGSPGNGTNGGDGTDGCVIIYF